MTQEDGAFMVPVRLYLTDEERQKLMHHVRVGEHDLNDIVSALVRTYVATLPDPVVPSVAETQAHELQTKRRELRRLKSRQQAEGLRAPRWLEAYIRDLEADILRLQAAQEQM